MIAEQLTPAALVLIAQKGLELVARVDIPLRGPPRLPGNSELEHAKTSIAIPDLIQDAEVRIPPPQPAQSVSNAYGIGSRSNGCELVGSAPGHPCCLWRNSAGVCKNVAGFCPDCARIAQNVSRMAARPGRRARIQERRSRGLSSVKGTACSWSSFSACARVAMVGRGALRLRWRGPPPPSRAIAGMGEGARLR